MSNRGISAALLIPAVLGTVSLIVGNAMGYDYCRKENTEFKEMYQVCSVLSSLVCFAGSLLCISATCFNEKTVALGVVIFPSYLLSVALALPWIALCLKSINGNGLNLLPYSFTLTVLGSLTVMIVGIFYLVRTWRRITSNPDQTDSKPRHSPHHDTMEHRVGQDNPLRDQMEQQSGHQNFGRANLFHQYRRREHWFPQHAKRDNPINDPLQQNRY